jgi:ABC-2 type transport system ATP-binding protein
LLLVAKPLSVRDLRRRFGRIRAVDGISFSLSRARVTGFLGPNGAGKTTTLSVIGGLLKPTTGTVDIEGHRIGRDTRRALEKVSFVLERPAFYTYLSGYRNLEIEARLRDCFDRSRIKEMLRLVGLESDGKRKVGGYSQGMRQRLAIARAFLSRPSLLVLDEPTTGLDVEGTEQILDLLHQAAKNEGVTVFLSSHHLSEIERICDDVIVIDHGKIIASGPVEDLVRGAEVQVVARFDRTEGIADWLRKHPTVRGGAVRDGGRVVFRIERRDFHSLLTGLIEAGFTIQDLEIRSQNLKEFFLEVLEKGDTSGPGGDSAPL